MEENRRIRTHRDNSGPTSRAVRPGNNLRQATRQHTTTRSGSMLPLPQRVCEYFIAKGTCRFGNACRFSHAMPVDERGGTTQLENRPQTLLFNLKGMIKSFSRLEQFQTLPRFEDFLDLALKVLDSKERDVQSEAVLVLSKNDLRDDDFAFAGYNVIRHVVEQVGNTQPRFASPLQYVEFEKHLVPFMKIIVHNAFTQACVEQSFRYVIKAVYGTDGERAAKFLKKVVTMLENKFQFEDLEYIKPIVQEGCLLVCRLLYYIVRYNSDAIGQDDLVGVHARLMELSFSIRTPGSGTIDRCLAETSAYLIPVSIKSNTEQYSGESMSLLNDRYQQRELLIDLPGALSNLYPRHDNDSHLIAKITILPTKNEVICARDPYLPLNDIFAPHFLDGASRLFDINFRLLREDMIGPLRTAVVTILDKIRPGLPVSKELSHQDRLREPNIASTRLYFDVAVKSAQFDKKYGLKFRLQFRQPKRFQPLSSENRMSYWTATRGLDKGSLLCLISNAPDFQCFLTVVEKEPKLLTQDPHWCWIDVTPEGKVDDNRETLLQRIRRSHVSDSLALVEFPGVLLTAYKTILESLQTRSKHPFLPFSNILCPRAHESKKYNPRSRVIDVSPPLYALSEGFRFDLQPLKHENASPDPLFLSPEASLDDEELIVRLERETTLDSGQCRGLIAGLTQEMALIQGEDGMQSTLIFKVHLEQGRLISGLNWSKHFSITRPLLVSNLLSACKFQMNFFILIVAVTQIMHLINFLRTFYQ